MLNWLYMRVYLLVMVSPYGQRSKTGDDEGEDGEDDAGEDDEGREGGDGVASAA